MNERTHLIMRKHYDHPFQIADVQLPSNRILLLLLVIMVTKEALHLLWRTC
jgi:hypothetical protein